MSSKDRQKISLSSKEEEVIQTDRFAFPQPSEAESDQLAAFIHYGALLWQTPFFLRSLSITEQL